ncbi:hypothetical protein P171DRAFT_480930 [Karstenula rhodostoma CBS 690.94]|uniref:C2H2-type domain-containing protein n=1 Tax=Karstenula rhodostoma CBS 690.94 TaxID=1392251 RepID=A0A9P4UI32_9PLEO|nr:hypothetical protein P171DRAFT_480930 [Karstenula rhodostoma CBS 690.94]
MVMSHYLSFSVSDDELERSTRSSEHSFEYADSIEGIRNDAPLGKGSRKSSDYDQRPRQRRKLNDQNSQFACPFAKHDPLLHRQCFRYNKMDQVSRLKQHLLRVHQVPIHCVRCSQTFSTEDERDTHLRSVSGCIIQPNQVHLGITETQKAQLAQRVSVKRSKEENWYLIYNLDGTQFSEELFAVREFAVREAPIRIAQLASALQHDRRFPPLPPKYKLRIEAFAFAAVKDAFDAVVDQWLRGDVSAVESEKTTLTTPLPPLHSKSSSSTSATIGKSPFDTWQTGSEGEGGKLDHGLPSIVEGPKLWTGLEEPSRLDWLSMVADMGANSWAEFLDTCFDGALQQPPK